jgi:mannose-6-phosphate isomerase
MPLYRLINPLKHYDWGSYSFIPQMIGQQPDPAIPVAELWMGAHPAASSKVMIDGHETSLREMISDDPRRFLGEAREIAGESLPFLLKVLAADRPLSIQAHPSKLQAAQGYARENSLGIPQDSPTRNYRDPNHKPELICALTEFQALCGFRPYQEVVENFTKAGIGHLFNGFKDLSRFLHKQSFQRFILEVMGCSRDKAREVIQVLNVALDTGIWYNPNLSNIVRELQVYYPGDIGVLAPLYLNSYVLNPGEALFLEAGVPHAYLAGAGIEVMANSDNVLRGGLTSKHVDLEELSRILDFMPYTSGLVEPTMIKPDWLVYDTPSVEFELSRLDVRGQRIETVAATASMILFCQEGIIKALDAAEEIVVRQGESLFITPSLEPLLITGSGTCWMVGIPSR